MTKQEALKHFEDTIKQYIPGRKCMAGEALERLNKEIAAAEIAVAALRDNVPRVLTVEEAQQLDKPCPVWVEAKWITHSLLVIIYPNSLGNFPAGDTIHYGVEYGTRYRFWSYANGNKPTAEQMAAEKWGEDNE